VESNSEFMQSFKDDVQDFNILRTVISGNQNIINSSHSQIAKFHREYTQDFIEQTRGDARSVLGSKAKKFCQVCAFRRYNSKQILCSVSQLNLVKVAFQIDGA